MAEVNKHTRNAVIAAGLLTFVLAGPAIGQRRPVPIGVDTLADDRARDSR